MSLIHCIYASSATRSFEVADIPSLLEHARAKNARLGITGMLLYIEGSIFQVLEGDAGSVDSIYTAISADRRHARVTQIIREPIAHRAFEDWTMGFESLDRGQASRLLGVNDFFATASCLERINPGRAKKLLFAFASGRWRADQTGVHVARARVA
ncbi:BLUF domain-containing protein [Peristeroidobacter soli]|uniref:BLUF domain-containing protein n=1 Tax=Peristeroidobacter soli TaxID=2497877 RepID=UPI00101C2679|nr:BLUF domain-containing protein [Peristeroidobacter soli]